MAYQSPIRPKLKVEMSGDAGTAYSFINAKQDFYTILERDPHKVEQFKEYIKEHPTLTKEELADDGLEFYIFNENNYFNELWSKLKPSQLRFLKEQVYQYFGLT